MSDERPRRSWRDIDRNRERSAHRREQPSSAGGGARGAARQQRSYRAALDRLFDSGKIAELVEQKDPSTAPEGGENRIKALASITSATGRDEVTSAVDAYRQAFGDGLPDDLEVLERVLEHRDLSLQLDAMTQIDTLLDTVRPKRTRAMLGQLRLIRDVGDDPELVRLATRLIERLD